MKPYYEEEGITLYNDDCYKLIKEIPSASIDLILTDPPYLIETNGGGMMVNRDYQQKINEMGLDCGYDMSILDEFLRVLKNPNMVIFASKKQIKIYIDFAENIKANWQMITWHKTNPTPLINNNYLPDTEYIFHIWKNKKLNGNYESRKTFYITSVFRNEYEHPNAKPLEIINPMVENGSAEGEIILDPFCGTGSTLVSSRILNRRTIGIEMVEKHCNTSAKRLSRLSGIADSKFLSQQELF